MNSQHIDLKNVPIDSTKKLQHKFLGPFTITDVIVPKMTFCLELPLEWKIHPVFHISKLKKHIEDDIFESRKALRPLPEIIGKDNHEEYKIECIVNKQIFCRQLQYLVNWKGYPDYENTWEPLHNLSNASEAISKYELK